MSVSGKEAKAWARETVVGLWTSPMIPFRDDGEVDHDGIRRNVDVIVDTKADGIGFGFSELWYLSVSEKMEAFSTFIDAVGGRLPCYVHALDYSIPETVNLSIHCREAGADAVMWWTPMEFARSDHEACKWFETVANQVDMPVFAYNTYHSGRNLSVAALSRIAEIENVCAIKDAVNDFGHTIETLSAVGDHVVVSNPLEEYLPAMLAFTSQQVLLGATSVYLMQSPSAQPIRDYVSSIRSGDHEGGWRQFYALKGLRDIWTDIYRVLWEKEAATHPVATIKCWMDLAGMSGGNVRPPLETLDAVERRAFEARLEGSGWSDALYPDRNWGGFAA